MTYTHTFAQLEVSPSAFAEIKAKLQAAGYAEALLDDRVIDMHGLGLVAGLEGQEAIVETTCPLCRAPLSIDVSIDQLRMRVE